MQELKISEKTEVMKFDKKFMKNVNIGQGKVGKKNIDLTYGCSSPPDRNVGKLLSLENDYIYLLS